LDFIPLNGKEIEEMLKVIGVNTLDDLFQDIPSDIKIKKLNLPSGLSEPDLLRELTELSLKNKVYSHSFLGAGCYYHYIPSLVNFIINRSEFYTSYTPYQAEASQGYLQAIYEYQTVISRLTQMDIANASMYDGSTALAEAAIMATIISGKTKILMLEGIHPEYIEVVKTYCWGQEINYDIIKEEQLKEAINEDIGAVLFQSPNFFGDIENIEELISIVRKASQNCLIIQVMTDPTCLGILKSPGELDIDIFVAEGQVFGIPPSFGGPGLGIFTAKQQYLRKMPGRLIGKTKEIYGEETGYILTLQAREQHIRREKASSNICTNQALCSLAALIYLLSFGKTGLKELASQNFQKANFLKIELKKISGYEILNKKPTYNEFMLRCPNIEGLINECNKNDILPPLRLSTYYPELDDVVLVCVTEKNSLESIEKFLNGAKKALNYIKERGSK